MMFGLTFSLLESIHLPGRLSRPSLYLAGLFLLHKALQNLPPVSFCIGVFPYVLLRQASNSPLWLQRPREFLTCYGPCIHCYKCQPLPLSSLGSFPPRRSSMCLQLCLFHAHFSEPSMPSNCLSCP